MEKQLYDIEIYRNFACWGLKDYTTKETKFFEISEERNDIHKIYDYFSKFSGFLISFNGLHYDNVVTKYFLKNYSEYCKWDWINVTSDLKRFSDKIITSDNFDEEIKQAKYYKTYWTDIDLFAYWSKMLRISKKISLKSLGIQLGYPVVQELPYKPNTILNIEDLPKLRHYNQVHDLGILELLLTNMEEEVRLRADILVDYKLNCWSMDAPKIASEALLADYCRMTGKRVWDVRKDRFIKETLYLNEVLKDFDPKFRLPIFQELYSEILNSKDGFSKDLIVNYNNTSIKLTYGIGGLHSVNENEQYYTTEDEQIVTSDVASLYPNLIINYLCIRYKEVLNRYGEVKSERLIAKKEKNKRKDTFLKLILNSTSGLLDNAHSWIYYPEGAMKLRLIGQIILTKCIEVCLINNWKVVSANTDGIEVIVPKKDLDKYKQLLDETCKDFGLDLEHEYYKQIVYKNVNNYHAITENGDIKRKGFFKIPFNEKGNREIPLGDSCNELVISKALNAYYSKDIEPREFISNPDKYDLHIYDYCKSNKISKDFTVYYNGEIQQNLNRYYFSKSKPYLFKRKNDMGTFQHINVNQGVTLFNNFEQKDWKEYDINYSYYIRKTQEIIDDINNHNQLTLF